MAKQSIFLNILNDIAAQIRAIGLPGISASRVKVRRMPTDGEQMFPGITVHPVTERIGRGVNDRDDIGYGVALTIVQNNSGSSLEGLDRILMWREQIRHHFLTQKTIVGEQCVFVIDVEHGYPIDWSSEFRKNYDISSMVLRCWVRENRDV